MLIIHLLDAFVEDFIPEKYYFQFQVICFNMLHVAGSPVIVP